mgnify:FL=1
MASNSSQPTNTADYTIDDIEDQENSWDANCGHRHQNARDRGNDNCWECDMNEIAEETTESRFQSQTREEVQRLLAESSEEEDESSEDEEIGLLMLGHNATVITDPPPPHSPPHTRREPTPPPPYSEEDTSPPPSIEEPRLDRPIASFVVATFDPVVFIYDTGGLDMSKCEYAVKWGTLYVETEDGEELTFEPTRTEEDDMKRPTRTEHYNEEQIDECEYWEPPADTSSPPPL